MLCACSEKSLTASEPQEFYEFPQGNAAYDQQIAAFYDKYNTQILYQYRESDFRWNITSSLPYHSSQADKDYVGKAVGLIVNDWLGLWDDDLLTEWLPYRILLASEIHTVTGSGNVYYPAVYGLNHIAFGHASEKIDQMTAAERRTAIGTLNRSLVAYAAAKGKLVIPAAFIALHRTTNQGQGGNYTGSWGYNGYGFLEYLDGGQSPAYDLGTYVKYLTSMTEADFKAWALSDAIDCSEVWDQSIGQWGAYVKTHLIRQKYEVVLKFFKDEYGIDLHAMGEALND